MRLDGTSRHNGVQQGLLVGEDSDATQASRRERHPTANAVEPHVSAVWHYLESGMHRERAVSVQPAAEGEANARRELRVRVQPVWRTNRGPPADSRQEPVPAALAEWGALPRPPRTDRT